MLTTGIQIGNAIGVALIGVVFYGALGDGAPDSHGRAFGWSLACLMLVNLMLAGLVQLLPKHADRGDPSPSARRPSG